MAISNGMYAKKKKEMENTAAWNRNDGKNIWADDLYVFDWCCDSAATAAANAMLLMLLLLVDLT